MSIKAKIIKIENGSVEIELLPNDKCLSCQGCFKAYEKKKNIQAKAFLPDFDLNISDTVLVKPKEPINEALGAFLLFGLPLISFVSILILFNQIIQDSSNNKDLISFLLALIFGFIAYMPAFYYSKKIQSKKSGKPEFVILKSIQEQSCKKNSPNNYLGNKREDLLRG